MSWYPGSIREPSVGAGWREVFIHAGAARDHGTAAESVASGQSVLLLDEIASLVECDKIRACSSSAAEMQRERPGAARAGARRGNRREAREAAARMAPGRIRMPIMTTWALEPAKTMCDALLTRALGVVETQIPGLHSALFKDLGHCSEVMDNPRFRFADNEPAINVYRTGGSFDRHQVILPNGASIASWVHGNDQDGRGCR